MAKLPVLIAAGTHQIYERFLRVNNLDPRQHEYLHSGRQLDGVNGAVVVLLFRWWKHKSLADLLDDPSRWRWDVLTESEYLLRVQSADKAGRE